MAEGRDALLARFDEKLDTLSERLTRTEEKLAARPRKTLAERLGMWGGLLALVISLGTGGVTFWDDVVNRSAKLEQARAEQVKTLMGEIQTINADVFQAEAEGAYARADALRDAFQSAKEKNILDLHAIFAESPELFSLYELGLLGNEFLEFGDAVRAKEIGDRMDELDPGFRSPQREFFYAQIHGMSGPLRDIPEARRRFEAARELWARNSDATRGVMGQLEAYGRLIQFEAAVARDCGVLLDAAARMEALAWPAAPHPPQTADAVARDAGRIKGAIRRAREGCR